MGSERRDDRDWRRGEETTGRVDKQQKSEGGNVYVESKLGVVSVRQTRRASAHMGPSRGMTTVLYQWQ